MEEENLISFLIRLSSWGFEVNVLGNISFYLFLEIHPRYVMIEAKGRKFMEDFMILLGFGEFFSFDFQTFMVILARFLLKIFS